MGYVPPSGWIQTRAGDEADAAVTRFHTSRECPRIDARDQVRPVDKPYSAARCSLCARETATAPAMA
jgi:hypothetical protein